MSRESTVTADEINNEFKTSFARLVKQYGSTHAIPRHEVHLISERMRARHIAVICTERSLGPLPRVLRDYGVLDSIIKELAGEVPEIERKSKRSDKNKAIFDWCDQNPGKETTVYEVAEIGGVSYSKANQLIKDRIDYFKKIKKGLYVIRNPRAERAEEGKK